MTNVLWCLARISAGEPSITPALVDRLWDERSGLFLDEVQPGGARPATSRTWAALSPLALPDLPEEIGRRLVEEHLLDPARYWLDRPAAVGLGGRADASSPTAAPGWKLRYWRGPTWVNAAWMLWLGPAPARLRGEARPMAERLGGDRPARGPARVLRPVHRRGPRRDATSPGPA